MNCAQNLERSALFFPERPAIREAGSEKTYSQLNHQANRIATGLIKLGLNPGELVGLCTPNSGDWIAFYFGVLKAGAVAVTLSGVLTGDELRNLVRHSMPRFIFTIGDRLKDLEPLRGAGGLEKVICPGGDLDLPHLMAMGSGSFEAVDRDRADTAVILYTGGTTGTPKGVMVPHEAVSFSSHSIAYYERSTENDVGICFLPFNHVFGQMHIMNSTILSAGCLELLPGFDVEQVLKLMETGRVTKFFAVPTVYVRFLSVDNLKNRIGRLRYSFSAAASMAVEIVKQWKERTGLTIAESYGLTEAMPLTYNHYYKHVVGSVGQAVHGVEIQIRDKAGNVVEQAKEGEICVRGRNVMKGYLNDPEGTRSAFWEGGWLRTGDIGLFDAHGYLYIVDRLKDLIITGGENVYPREVEEVLYTRNEVEGCVVVGVPDQEWGERVIACIVPKPGQKIVPEELKAFLRTRLSPFKVPKEYVILNELPKSPTGKVLKRDLRKRLIEGNR